MFRRLSTLCSLFAILMIGLTQAIGAQGADAKIKIIVTQVLGAQSSKFVAGKDTVIRVFLSEPVAVDATNQAVVVKRGGATIATLRPSPEAEPTQVVDFACPNRAACGDWQAGDYTFEATIGKLKATTTAKFQERRALRILAVGVKANYGPGDVRAPVGKWKKLGEFMKQVYPIAPANFRWVNGQDLDLSADEYNLKTEEGQLATWEALAKLQPHECTANPAAPKCYDLIVGFVRDRQGADGTTQGFTFGAPANIVTETDEDAPATVAHEVGHVFKLGDEYDQMNGAFNCAINPPPAGFVGRDWDNMENTGFKCGKSDAQEFSSGSGSLVSADTEFPYEVGGRGALPDMIGYMGSGAPQESYWTTPRYWTHLFDQLAPGAKISSAPRLAKLVNPTRYVAAFGTISKEGKVTLEPWYSFTESTTLAETTGKYSIQAVDASGKVLASRAFNVSFTTTANPPRTLARVPFDLTVPFPEKTVAFNIMNGTTLLHAVKVLPNAPEITILAPKAGDKVDGMYTIKWQGKHKDGAALLYSVEYSNDGEDWVELASEITATTWEDDFATLPGNAQPQSRIRITATDGVNATQVESSWFSVSPQAPEVYIEEPEGEITIKVGQDLDLLGSAYDLQDEWLVEDNELVWSSDLQGALGNGELINVSNLKPGKHTITLTATNSFKLSGKATVIVNVK